MIDFNQPQTVKAIAKGGEPSAEIQRRDLRGLPLSGLLRAINHVLQQQGWARERLIAHQGKSVRLGIDGSFPLAALVPNLMTEIDADGFLTPASVAGADVSLWLRPSLDAMFGGLRKGPAGLSNHLRVEGDVLLAGLMGELAQHLRWDFEEDLSRVVGDAGAHRAVSSAQALGARLQDSQQRLESSAVQWLTVEQAYLADRASFAAFSEELRELTRTVDRLSSQLAGRP